MPKQTERPTYIEIPEEMPDNLLAIGCWIGGIVIVLGFFAALLAWS